MSDGKLEFDDDGNVESNRNEGKKDKFSFEEFIYENRFSVLMFLLGLIVIGLGMFLLRNGTLSQNEQVEVLESTTEAQDSLGEIVVEIAGAVEKPGVYKLPGGSRIEDLLIAAGGLTAEADRQWMEKVVNRAAILSDGQKIFIADEHSLESSAKNEGGIEVYQGSGGSGVGNFININSASQKVLEELPGIGPVYAQNIIEHRPYSSIEELVSKCALKQFVFEKIKDKVSVY